MLLDVIQLDEAHSLQEEFLAACKDRNAVFVDVRAEGLRTRLWAKDRHLQRLSERLPARLGPTLAFLGSGDFHHVTALLLEKAAAMSAEPFTVLHFDNHPDWVHFRGGMHCGSWVNRALYLPKVMKVMTVGVTSGDLKYPELKGGNLDPVRAGKLELFTHPPMTSFVTGLYGEGTCYRQEGNHLDWSSIEGIGLEQFASLLVSRIPTKAVYITLDKDVLDEDCAITNWDQGRMRLEDVSFLIRQVAGAHDVIGADVIGDYSPVHYAGGAWSVLQKRGESLIDHPQVRLDPAIIASVNEAVNLRLLNLFSEFMQ